MDLANQPMAWMRSCIGIRTHGWFGIAAAALVLLGAAKAAAEPRGEHTNVLRYDADTASVVPIPPSERGLQTVMAEPYFQVSEQSLILEGPAFDRQGDLLFVDAGTGRVFRLTSDKHLSVVVSGSILGASGLAIHKDGRIFIAAVGNLQNGSVRAISPDGSGRDMVIPSDAGYLANDLVFDDAGGFYFTDSRGSSTDSSGGVFYVPPDRSTVILILAGLAVGNGIALSPDGRELWAVEFGRNALHRIRLTGPTTVRPFGTTVAYRFQGPTADSMRVDRDGNLYVAITGQGRVLVFNRRGIPIGQILLPGRDEGRHLLSTSLAIRPGSDEILIVTNSGSEPGGATIFRARGFARAHSLFSHQ